jgi:hypothetical protein
MKQDETMHQTHNPGGGLHKTETIKETPLGAEQAKKKSNHNRPQDRERKSRSLQRTSYLIVFLLIVISVCVAAPVFAGGIAYISILESPKILPNVTSAGLSVGKLTVAEGADLIHQGTNLNHKIVLTNQILSQSVPMSDLGISVDAIKTAESAYLLGRTGSLLTRIKTIFQAYTEGISIAPVIVVDTNQTQSGLEALAPFFSKAPTEASFYLDNDQVKAWQGEIGYTVNMADTITLIRNNPENIFYTRELTVPLQPVLPTTFDLAGLLREAQQVVQTPVELIFYDPILDQWNTEMIPRTTILDWLTITNSGSGLQINPVKINDYLNLINQSLLPGRSIDINYAGAMILDTIMNKAHPVILIHHQPTTYIVQPEDTLLKIGWKLGFPYWQIGNANPSLDPDQIAQGTEITIPSKNVLLPLPIVLHKRIIISIGEQRLWVYEYGKQIQKFVISTGIDRSPTQPGVFQVQTHVRSAYASIWDLTMPNFLGIYEAWPGFMNGIHGLPTLSNGRILWANILGKPASYGCIILTLDAAEWLYQWAEDGVVVEIRP